MNIICLILESQCGGTAISKHTILTAAHCCINQYRVIAHFNDKVAGSYEPDEFSVESQEFFHHPFIHFLRLIQPGILG